MFSNNMIQKYVSGRGNITCRKHTAGPVLEMMCAFCHKVKPLNGFSNNERKVNSSHRCRDCVEWSETDVPGYAPLPPPNTMRSIEEREFYNRPQQVLEVSDLYEQEQYTTESHNAGLSANDTSSVGGSKHSTAGNPDGLTTDALKSFNASNAASSRGGSSHHVSSAPTDTASTIGIESTVGPRGHVQFNAFGPDGQYQRRVQTVTAPSDTTAATQPSGVPGRKNWAKVPGRKTGLAAPSYLQYENPDEIDESYDSDGSLDFC